MKNHFVIVAPVEVELLERVVGAKVGQDEGEVAHVLDVQLGRVPVVRQLGDGGDPLAWDSKCVSQHSED